MTFLSANLPETLVRDFATAVPVFRFLERLR
jgi:hypothetical protein